LLVGYGLLVVLFLAALTALTARDVVVADLSAPFVFVCTTSMVNCSRAASAFFAASLIFGG
jgi:hypothetical protein